jgi:hypothetical protein
MSASLHRSKHAVKGVPGAVSSRRVDGGAKGRTGPANRLAEPDRAGTRCRAAGVPTVRARRRDRARRRSTTRSPLQQRARHRPAGPDAEPGGQTSRARMTDPGRPTASTGTPALSLLLQNSRVAGRESRGREARRRHRLRLGAMHGTAPGMRGARAPCHAQRSAGSRLLGARNTRRRRSGVRQAGMAASDSRPSSHGQNTDRSSWPSPIGERHETAALRFWFSRCVQHRPHCIQAPARAPWMARGSRQRDPCHPAAPRAQPGAGAVPRGRWSLHRSPPRPGRYWCHASRLSVPPAGVASVVSSAGPALLAPPVAGRPRGSGGCRVRCGEGARCGPAQEPAGATPITTGMPISCRRGTSWVVTPA